MREITITSKFFASVLAGVALFALHSNASTKTLLERGTYLMTSIVACGNCHTPKSPTGDIPGMLPPMAYAYYANIKHQDLDAIVAYLRTLQGK